MEQSAENQTGYQIIFGGSMDIKKQIKEKPFNGITRFMNIPVMNFGGEVKNGNIKRKELTIHIKCNWRIIIDKKIAAGSADMYVPWGIPKMPDMWDPFAMGHEDEESSIFDVKIRSINERLAGQYVKDFEISDFGEFRMTFEDGTLLETFVDLSRRSEFWKAQDGATGEEEYFFKKIEVAEPTWQEVFGMTPEEGIKNNY